MVFLVEKQSVLVSKVSLEIQDIDDKSVFNQSLNVVLSQFREELDDHREAINENTTELQSNYNLIDELYQKIDKLSERMEELTLLVKGNKEQKMFAFSPLNEKEKNIFSALYTSSQSGNSVSYRQISRITGIPEQLVASYISAIIEKGIPLLKQYSGGNVYLRIEDDFRQEQTKKNIVGINSTLNCWVVQ